MTLKIISYMVDNFNHKRFAYLNKMQWPFLLGVALLISLFTSGQKTDYALVRTPQDVTVNRTVPKNVLAPGAVMPAKFSKDPTDEEIYRVHFFEEPLVPASGSEDARENAALVNALAGFSQRTSPDDFTSLTNFLKKYSHSRWRGSLLANLGIVYRRTGYYNEAMKAWNLSWEALKTQTDRKAKVLADRVLSELLLMNAWVGRQQKIESLFKEIDQRTIEGPASERVASMRVAFWQMKNNPGISFKCGPYALNMIYMMLDSTGKMNDTLMNTRSTPKGFSLYELEKMADKIGMKYQMAFRTAGSVVIPRAVVHWKLEHYSALVNFESGHYKCEDATVGTVYGQQFWLTPAALDSSASGYFLVPEGVLPQGWRRVMPDEGSKIFGKGKAPNNARATKPKDKTTCGGNGPMAQCNVHLSAMSLHVYDRPVYYSPPVGPAVLWDIDYHQRDSYQPANFTYSNLGPKWTFKWLSYLQDNPSNLSANADLYVMGGGAMTFTSFNAATQSYAPEIQTNDLLVRICPSCYEVRHPDGSKDVYARTDGSTVNGRKIFLTQSVDPAGNSVSLMYDANLRIVGLKDAIGQISTIQYGNNSDIYKITKIIDPFGRFASFGYDAQGRLNKITDMIGIVSSFQYDAGDFMTQMTTPYGTTSFVKQEGPDNFVSLEMHYPLGEKERVEFNENVPGFGGSEAIVPTGMNLLNQYMNYRSTYYWDKKAMKENPGDYTKARLYHWLHGSGATNEDGIVSPILESIKEPLENRVWFRYQNQTVSSVNSNQGMSSQPSQIGRVMDDGKTQLSVNAYNTLGADTLTIDPLGRTIAYLYDTNKIDLKEIRQIKNGANELIAKFVYNGQHLPRSVTDGSGLTTIYTYNSVGQVTTVTNPKHEVTTMSYDGNGYLKSITGAIPGSTVSFVYDAFGRVRTVTSPEGYSLTTDYDVLDRPTLVTYPDSTFEQTVYDRLDAVHKRDRMGRWSHTIYDSLDRPNVIQDALGRITQLIWCSCGSVAEIVDPLKQVTSFIRDVQGRITTKVYNDGKTVNYRYENTTSRLREVMDAKGQKTQYSYFIDDNLKQVDYVNALIATPSVSYMYDTIYNRIDTMKDGTGSTVYAYNAYNSGLGSGQLATIDGPLANDVISYSYDSVNRINGRSINGISSAVTFDALGRITNETNALGRFVYNYVDQTERLASMLLPNGQSTVYDYFDNKGDLRLKQLWNKALDGSTLSKFDYNYNSEGQITKWAQQTGTTSPTEYSYTYDLADQLIAATQRSQGTSAILKRYAYQYDKAGNRTSEQIDNTVTSSVYNSVNQLTSQQDRGPMRFNGTVDKFSSIFIKNQTSLDSTTATVDTANIFEAFIKVVPGANNIAITATDYSGNNNLTFNNYNIAVTAGTNNSVASDNNGNTIFAASPGVTYDWDAADRLVKITSASGISEFIYDGLSRRVAEKLNGNIIKRWLWVGTQVAQERDATGGVVNKLFFDQGEQINGTNYYFSRDHLGSIRELTDLNGMVQARYDYDPYGRRIKIIENVDADFGYTGYYYHSSTHLSMAMWRLYDMNLGRWLNRDPIKEEGGLNLYKYVNNNTVNYTDPYGEQIHGIGVIVGGSGEGGMVVGAGGTIFGGQGVFWGGDYGTNLGTFWGYGGAFADKSLIDYEGQKPIIIGQSSPGLNAGIFFTNVTCVKDLGGPFKEYHINTPWFSISYGVSGNNWIFSITKGSGVGISISQYPTITFPSNVVGPIGNLKIKKQ